MAVVKKKLVNHFINWAYQVHNPTNTRQSPLFHSDSAGLLDASLTAFFSAFNQSVGAADLETFEAGGGGGVRVVGAGGGPVAGRPHRGQHPRVAHRDALRLRQRDGQVRVVAH